MQREPKTKKNNVKAKASDTIRVGESTRNVHHSLPYNIHSYLVRVCVYC